MFDKLFRRSASEGFIAKAQAMIADAMTLPPTQGVQRIDHWLADTVTQALTRQHALATLDDLDESLCQLLRNAEHALFTGAGHATRITLLLQAMLPFTRNLAGHYAQALQQEAPLLARRTGQVPLVQSAIAHTLFWHSKHFLLQFLLSPMQTFQWQHILALNEYARKIEPSPALRLGGTASQLGNVRRQLAYLLLLNRSLARDLNARQTLLADRMVELLSTMVLLGEQHSADTPFCTPLDNGPPTLSTDRHAPPDAQRPPVFFGLTRCITELQSLEHMVQQEQHVPSQLDPGKEIDVGEALTVLRNLRLRWSGKQVTRKHRRIGTSGAVQLIYEFTPIRRLIALGDQASRHKTYEPTRVDAEADNISASGIGLKLKGDCQWATIGRLAGIRQPDTSRWSLGIIRRFTAQPDGAFIGVQVLSTTPQAVRLQEKSDTSHWEQVTQHDVYSNILAMLIVGAADQPLRLITPGKVLLRGHVYGIPEQATHQQVRIGELQEIGSDFAIYLAYPVNRAATTN